MHTFGIFKNKKIKKQRRKIKNKEEKIKKQRRKTCTSGRAI
jgi:hypothetical protein